MGPWKASDYDNWLDNYGNPGIQPEEEMTDEEMDLAAAEIQAYYAKYGTGNVNANDEKDLM